MELTLEMIQEATSLAMAKAMQNGYTEPQIIKLLIKEQLQWMVLQNKIKINNEKVAGERNRQQQGYVLNL